MCLLLCVWLTTQIVQTIADKKASEKERGGWGDGGIIRTFIAVSTNAATLHSTHMAPTCMHGPRPIAVRTSTPSYTHARFLHMHVSTPDKPEEGVRLHTVLTSGKYNA